MFWRKHCCWIEEGEKRISDYNKVYVSKTEYRDFKKRMFDFECNFSVKRQYIKLLVFFHMF